MPQNPIQPQVTSNPISAFAPPKEIVEQPQMAPQEGGPAPMDIGENNYAVAAQAFGSLSQTAAALSKKFMIFEDNEETQKGAALRYSLQKSYAKAVADGDINPEDNPYLSLGYADADASQAASELTFRTQTRIDELMAARDKGILTPEGFQRVVDEERATFLREYNGRDGWNEVLIKSPHWGQRFGAQVAQSLAQTRTWHQRRSSQEMLKRQTEAAGELTLSTFRELQIGLGNSENETNEQEAKSNFYAKMREQHSTQLGILGSGPASEAINEALMEGILNSPDPHTMVGIVEDITIGQGGSEDKLGKTQAWKALRARYDRRLQAASDEAIDLLDADEQVEVQQFIEAAVESGVESWKDLRDTYKNPDGVNTLEFLSRRTNRGGLSMLKTHYEEMVAAAVTKKFPEELNAANKRMKELVGEGKTFDQMMEDGEFVRLNQKFFGNQANATTYNKIAAMFKTHEDDKKAADELKEEQRGWEEGDALTEKATEAVFEGVSLKDFLTKAKANSKGTEEERKAAIAAYNTAAGELGNMGVEEAAEYLGELWELAEKYDIEENAMEDIKPLLKKYNLGKREDLERALEIWRRHRGTVETREKDAAEAAETLKVEERHQKLEAAFEALAKDGARVEEAVEVIDNMYPDNTITFEEREVLIGRFRDLRSHYEHGTSLNFEEGKQISTSLSDFIKKHPSMDSDTAFDHPDFKTWYNGLPQNLKNILNHDKLRSEYGRIRDLHGDRDATKSSEVTRVFEKVRSNLMPLITDGTDATGNPIPLNSVEDVHEAFLGYVNGGHASFSGYSITSYGKSKVLDPLKIVMDDDGGSIILRVGDVTKSISFKDLINDAYHKKFTDKYPDVTVEDAVRFSHEQAGGWVHPHITSTSNTMMSRSHAEWNSLTDAEMEVAEENLNDLINGYDRAADTGLDLEMFGDSLTISKLRTISLLRNEGSTDTTNWMRQLTEPGTAKKVELAQSSMAYYRNKLAEHRFSSGAVTGDLYFKANPQYGPYMDRLFEREILFRILNNKFIPLSTKTMEDRDFNAANVNKLVGELQNAEDDALNAITILGSSFPQGYIHPHAEPLMVTSTRHPLDADGNEDLNEAPKQVRERVGSRTVYDAIKSVLTDFKTENPTNWVSNQTQPIDPDEWRLVALDRNGTKFQFQQDGHLGNNRGEVISINRMARFVQNLDSGVINESIRGRLVAAEESNTRLAGAWRVIPTRPSGTPNPDPRYRHGTQGIRRKGNQ